MIEIGTRVRVLARIDPDKPYRGSFEGIVCGYTYYERRRFYITLLDDGREVENRYATPIKAAA